MPLYNYKCQNCKSTSEVMVSMQDKASGKTLRCPQCGSLDLTQITRPVTFARRRTAKGGCCGPSCKC